MGKLINRIPGLRLLISSLPGKALRTHVDIARLAERFNMRFLSKPSLVNLISKDTHLVFSMYLPSSCNYLSSANGVYFASAAYIQVHSRQDFIMEANTGPWSIRSSLIWVHIISIAI